MGMVYIITTLVPIDPMEEVTVSVTYKFFQPDSRGYIKWENELCFRERKWLSCADPVGGPGPGRL